MFKDMKQYVGHTAFVESVQNAFVVQQKQPRTYNCRVEYSLIFQGNLAENRADIFFQKYLEVFCFNLFPFWDLFRWQI
jgi:hypothetical protein